jgi:3'(2'), 5'-bisphosphate nucleotidase/myo-inositol-1(or 4)-monophosphatase
MTPELRASPWFARLDVAIAAVRSAGSALLELRGFVTGVESAGGQLKTSVDLAAEGWVLGFLDGSFPGELVLAEERFDRDGVPWPGARDYWTVDALDGTRSFVEGFDGFCVQVAYVADGLPRLGAIYEPVTRAVYAAAEGAGAWRDTERLHVAAATGFARGFRYIDSTRPDGEVGELVSRYSAELVECGSVGLKICRVAEGRGELYAKRFNYKLWDVAPGDVLLREAGGALSTWDGTAIDFAGERTHYPTLLAAPAALAPAAIAELR